MATRKASIIIVGAGPSGIAMAYNLKHIAGIDSFTIYEQAEQPGGVWHLNTYPNCGCDVYSHLYSFSFNMNPDWSCELANQPEIERYMNQTIDKFGFRPHIHTRVSVIAATWNKQDQVWVVELKDLRTGKTFFRESEVFISCVGAISIPKDCAIPGHESFSGEIWHSARWNHNFDYRNKRIAVIGNGCSASQFVPALVQAGATVTQYARSPQWYHPRPNHNFSTLQRALFRYVPFLQRLYRMYLFLDTDALIVTYLASPAAEKVRKKVEADSLRYMKATAPAKYHQLLTPNFPLGCKRRVFDPGYLECLHEPNIELLGEAPERIEGSSIVSNSGKRDFDAIVLATGYKVQEFLTPMKISGTTTTLEEHWEESRGAQAYKGTFVSGFPNLAIIFGPNSFPAHNSVIYTAEVQAEFTRKALIEPLMFGRARSIDVTQAAEDRDATTVQLGLKNMVWEAGCTNWYLNKWGRNTASYHGKAATYWFETFFPKSTDFSFHNSSLLWPARAIVYYLRRYRRRLAFACLLTFFPSKLDWSKVVHTLGLNRVSTVDASAFETARRKI